ncbi:hypothetical protein BU17DRAFT_60083 [Hysterangium stoloniferum]|nr:hypothetical protein BU17DRAFT_60083 [Hysterangium stoloniferum]
MSRKICMGYEGFFEQQRCTTDIWLPSESMAFYMQSSFQRFNTVRGRIWDVHREHAIKRKKVDAALLLTEERQSMANPPLSTSWYLIRCHPSQAEVERILVNVYARSVISKIMPAGNNQVTLWWSVKLCEVKTESDGKLVLVKMSEAGDPLGI